MDGKKDDASANRLWKPVHEMSPVRDKSLKEYEQVCINGVVYDTELDAHGVHRFKKTIEKKDWPDCNQMCYDLADGRITPQQFAEINMNIGYSIDGFCDFIHDRVALVMDNPCWSELWISSKIDKCSNCKCLLDCDCAVDKNL